MPTELTYEQLLALIEFRSKYLSTLQDEFGKKDQFNQNIQRILLLAKRKEINVDCLEPFVVFQDTGQIYLFFNEAKFEMLRSLFKLLLSQSIDITELKSQLKQIYKNLAEKNSRLTLLFELAVIKSFLIVYNENKEHLTNKKNVFSDSLSKLRDILIEIRNEIYSYNMFNRDFHSKILDKSLILSSPEFTDSWDTLKEKINSFSFPFKYFVDLVRIFNTAASLEKELDIIDYFENRTVWSVDDILKPVHVNYMPFIRNEVKDIILKTISKKSRQTRDYLMKEKDDLDKQITQLKTDMTEVLNQFNSDVSSELNDTVKFPMDIGIINKLNSFIIDFNRNLMANVIMGGKLNERFLLFQKKMVKNEQTRNIAFDQYLEILRQQNSIEPSEIFLSILIFNDYSSDFSIFFEKYKPQILKVAKTTFDSLKKEYSENQSKEVEEDISLMQNLFLGSGFQKKFNYQFIKDKFTEIMESISNDLMVYLLIDSVRLYNFQQFKDPVKKKKESLYASFNLIPKRRFFYCSSTGDIYPDADKIKNVSTNELNSIITNNYSRVVSTLVYDIRGSSFMSSKLNNAEKQKFIMKKFQNTINNVIKNNSGIPVKETGDGGITVFSANNREIYRNIFKESISSKNVHIRHSIASGAEILLKETNTSSMESIKCSLKMVEAAEGFIKDNFINYREWFFDVHEKKVIHEGIEYALLPPEFKSLFRIGIGVASGLVNRDINLSINAFGDIDLYGTNVNEAKMFSGGKDPTSSVVIVDHTTLFNLILNADYFDITTDVFSESSRHNEEIFKDLIVGKNTLNIENIKFKYYGLYLPMSREKNESLIFDKKISGLSIDSNGKIFFEGGEAKILYQIEQ
ncbi:MAG: hypothetical protein PHW02_03440 [bacterium]|nr:hypothetical protein [bacterium]